MPTLCQFVDGICRGKQVGFEGLADDMPEGREDEWPTILLANILANNGMIDASNIIDEQSQIQEAHQKMNEMRKNSMKVGSFFDLDLDTDEDDI